MSESRHLEACARAAHEAVRAVTLYESPGVQPWRVLAWEQSPDWVRVSTIELTTYALNDAEPSAMHEYWRGCKLRQGWKHGKEEDASKKTHPNLVSFDDLPYAEKQKYVLFRSVAQATDAALEKHP